MSKQEIANQVFAKVRELNALVKSKEADGLTIEYMGRHEFSESEQDSERLDVIITDRVPARAIYVDPLAPAGD